MYRLPNAQEDGLTKGISGVLGRRGSCSSDGAAVMGVALPAELAAIKSSRKLTTNISQASFEIVNSETHRLCMFGKCSRSRAQLDSGAIQAGPYCSGRGG